MAPCRCPLAVVALLAAPFPGFAQPVDGLYVGLGAGYNDLQDVDVRRFGVDTGVRANVLGSSFRTPGEHLHGTGGPLVVGSIGYGFGNGLRLEVEGSWRFQHDTLANAARRRGGADLQTYGGFVNTLYDIPVDFPVQPYVGVGVGYQETFGKKFRYYFPGSGSAGYINQYDFSNHDRGSFAAQAILGASYPVTALPGLALTAEYRFMAVVDNETFRGTFTNVFGQTSAFTKLGPQYNHAVLLGLRFAFNTPNPPPPAPAPAPSPAQVAAPSRTYLVFFDWDRADLTARARQIIGQAAASAQNVALTRIEVNGHTDLSGTPAYNQRLSVRRAEAVAAELARDGVAPDQILARGFGEANPLVPTAQGVREPQNRRVEIVLK